MKYETSAGGVIVSSRNKKLYFLLLKDKNKEWTFPKGLVEKGEDREKTAEREIAEEVGIKNLKLLSTLTPIEYLYKWEGELTQKKVYYYIFSCSGEVPLQPQREEGILDVQWFRWVDAEKKIGYKKTNVPLLKEARSKLEKFSI